MSCHLALPRAPRWICETAPPLLFATLSLRWRGDPLQAKVLVLAGTSQGFLAAECDAVPGPTKLSNPTHTHTKTPGRREAPCVTTGPRLLLSRGRG